MESSWALESERNGFKSWLHDLFAWPWDSSFNFLSLFPPLYNEKQNIYLLDEVQLGTKCLKDLAQCLTHSKWPFLLLFRTCYICPRAPQCFVVGAQSKGSLPQTNKHSVPSYKGLSNESTLKWPLNISRFVKAVSSQVLKNCVLFSPKYWGNENCSTQAFLKDHPPLKTALSITLATVKEAKEMTPKFSPLEQTNPTLE